MAEGKEFKLADIFRFRQLYKGDRESILLNYILLTAFFAYLAYDIVYVVFDPKDFLPAILTISPFLILTAALYFLYTPRHFELIKFAFIMAHTIVISILVFYAVGKVPGIQYVYIAFGVAPLLLYKKKHLFGWVLISLVNFFLFILADVTHLSLVPADFVFPEVLIVPFRISLILATVLSISSFIGVFYAMNEQKTDELKQLNNELLEKNNLISEHQEELSRTNDKLQASLVELEKQQKLLKESNATKDKFYSIIAHDLKNPLNSIMGFSEILDTKFENLEIEKQKKYIHVISESSRSLFDLLENLLQWSRIQTGRLSYQPSSFQLFDAVKPNIELMEASIQQKSITINNSIDPEISVYADISMVTTVIRNLLSNAVKFTHKSGNIFLDSEIDNHMMKVKIRDNGVGINPDQGSKLFSFDKNTSTQGTSGEDGTGLGLVLCSDFIKRNHGEIGFDSEVGKGATFWFTLLLEERKEN